MPLSRFERCQGGIMLVRSRLPHFDSCRAAPSYPRSKNNDLCDGLRQPVRDLQLSNYLAPPEDPYSDLAPISFSTPCREDPVLPCHGRCNFCRCLRSSQEDQVQAFAQIVGVEASAYGRRDLKGGFAERKGGERDRS